MYTIDKRPILAMKADHRSQFPRMHAYFIDIFFAQFRARILWRKAYIKRIHS